MDPTLCSFLPIPDLFTATSVLFIQPHPDDMEIGAGATVARLTDNGIPVTCLTITDGSSGTTNPAIKPANLKKVRQQESEKSAAILGVDNLIWLNYPDGGFLPYEEVRGKITRTIRQFKPDAVMVCDPWLPYEVHSDHIRSGLAAAEAAFLCNMPHFYPADLNDGLKPHGVKMIAFYYTAHPNTFIKAEHYWEKKIKAISCHTSQFPPDKMKHLQHLLELKAVQESGKGAEKGLRSEAIKLLTMEHLHIFEDTWRC